MLETPSPLCVFVRFSMTPLPSSTNILFEWPLRLFFHLFKSGENVPIRVTRQYNKPFFDQLVKNKQLDLLNLLDYLYHQNYYKLTGIDL